MKAADESFEYFLRQTREYELALKCSFSLDLKKNL